MNKCARCGKTVYPTEELKCLDKLWHKVCFKCDECGMALSMKNYKGFNKIPYCSVHCPQVKATTVTETPESRRLAENTRLQSQVKYHEDFEKSKGKLTQVADDPETMRVMNTHKIISNVSYHGDLQKKKEMEERRLFLPNDTPGQIQVNGNHAVSGHQSQSNRHQVFAQQPQQQMAYNVHHQMNRVQHQQHSPQQFSSSIKILSQGNKAVDVKQQQQQQQQQQLQQQKIQQKQQTSNGMKQPTVSQSGQQLNQQTGKNSNGISSRNPPQQFPQGNDFNQNQSHVQQNCPRPAVNTVTPVTTINQQPNRVSHSNQVLSQTQYQGVNLGGYSVIYDGSGQRVVDNSRKVQEYDAMNQKYGPGVGFPGMKAPHQQLHYQSQQQSLPNYGQGAAAAQQQYHQQIMQQQQYLMQQQTQSMPLNQQQSLVHGSPMRSTSSGLMPVSGIQSLPPSSSLTVRAIYDYSAADVDEVSFLDGDVIVDCIPIDEGWMTGTVHRTGQRGMLPANYVESCQ